MIRRHVTNCDRLTGKPEVIPETESLHYLHKSQGRPRRRILSTRLVLTSLLVCAKCAQQACTRLLRTAPLSRQRQMQVAENAGALGLAKVQHHTQNPPGFGPWGFDSPSRHHRFQRSYLHSVEKMKCTTCRACVPKVCAKWLGQEAYFTGFSHWRLSSIMVSTLENLRRRNG
jgi:hypothetical protein